MSKTNGGVTPREFTKRVRERIERGWCQNHDAIDVYGEPCDVGSELAAYWCLEGAIHAEVAVWQASFKEGDQVSDDQPDFPLWNALRPLVCEPLILWNDAPERRRADVVALLRKVEERFSGV